MPKIKVTAANIGDPDTSTLNLTFKHYTDNGLNSEDCPDANQSLIFPEGVRIELQVDGQVFNTTPKQITPSGNEYGTVQFTNGNFSKGQVLDYSFSDIDNLPHSACKGSIHVINLKKPS